MEKCCIGKLLFSCHLGTILRTWWKCEEGEKVAEDAVSRSAARLIDGQLHRPRKWYLLHLSALHSIQAIGKHMSRDGRLL